MLFRSPGEHRLERKNDHSTGSKGEIEMEEEHNILGYTVGTTSTRALPLTTAAHRPPQLLLFSIGNYYCNCTYVRIVQHRKQAEIQRRRLVVGDDWGHWIGPLLVAELRSISPGLLVWPLFAWLGCVVSGENSYSR